MKKSIINLFAFLAIIAISLGCSSEEEDPKPVTESFEATFMTTLVSFEENSGCTAPMNFLNTQQGDGTATQIGDFTTQITFCVNPSTFQYENAQGSFVAKNGDELFISGGGQVLPSDEPGYDLEFKDPFTITGGTGQFAGASGSGMTASYVNMTTGQTDHVWTGTITLIK